MKTRLAIVHALLERAKCLAARASSTLRERKEPVTLADARVGGNGFQRGFQGASRERILEATYEGRGA
jgi:hypothetical protein